MGALVTGLIMVGNYRTPGLELEHSLPDCLVGQDSLPRSSEIERYTPRRFIRKGSTEWVRLGYYVSGVIAAEEVRHNLILVETEFGKQGYIPLSLVREMEWKRLER